MAASVPPSPTGTIGRPGRDRPGRPAPSWKLVPLGPDLAGALGEQHQGLTPLQHLLAGAQRLAVGGAPLAPGSRRPPVKNQAPNLFFHNDSLPM